MKNEDILKNHYGNIAIDLALVLGSGLGHLIDEIDGEALPYAKLAGFPKGGVSGHVPKIKIGLLEGKRVAVLGGRQHYYEEGQADAMREPLRVLRALGVQKLLLTNAAGSLREDMPPGSIMMLNDHINFSGKNPLIGEPHDARFVPLGDAYNLDMQDALRKASARSNEDLYEGVYMWFSGPSFETPAEIRAARLLGADAVGMSTVPEVILARFFGIEVAAISVITNMGAGMADATISHEQTKAMAPLGALKLEKLLKEFLRTL